MAEQDMLFGLTAELIKRFPELAKVKALVDAKDFTEATLELQKTDFYRNLNEQSRLRALQKAGQPGVYAQGLDAFKLQQRQRIIARGIRLDDATLDQILESAYDLGLSDDQVDLKVLADFTTKGGRIGGDVLGSVQALREYASSFGVGYTQSTIDNWSKDIFAGLTTTEDVQQRIRQDAASAFPAYADQIDKGTSMDAIASAYKTSMANILERDPDSITFNDSRLRKALQYTVDGKPSVMPLWQFERELRSSPEWEYTDNARDMVDSLSLKVLRDWGLA